MAAEVFVKVVAIFVYFKTLFQL